MESGCKPVTPVTLSPFEADGMTRPRREPSRFELEMLARIAAGWKCEDCQAEHGQPHPCAPSSRVFLHVVVGRALCGFCRPAESS